MVLKGDNLPIAPFELDETKMASTFGFYEAKNIKIKDHENFSKYLRADIGMGPKGWNATKQDGRAISIYASRAAELFIFAQI